MALTARGARTGLIDADLYGPDVPRMMGLRRRTEASSVTLFARPGALDSRLQISHQAAQDADEGRPVMITAAVPEQVAAYELIAAQLADRF